MSKAMQPRNMFNCEPCRQIIQFLDTAIRVDAERLVEFSFGARRIETVRAA